MRHAYFEVEYTYYWNCPYCGFINSTVNDEIINNDILECENCHKKAIATDTVVQDGIGYDEDE